MEVKHQKISGDPNGTEKQVRRWRKCQRTKQRNEARRQWRIANPGRGGMLRCWPLPS